jgi:hypothetical protein
MKMLDLGKGFVVNHGVPPAICLMIAPNDMAVVGAAVLAATGDEGACSGVISEISFCFCVIFLATGIWRRLLFDHLLPPVRIIPTPLLHAKNIVRAFEVIRIFSQPSFLACGLARYPALGKMTESLPFAVTIIGDKNGMTVNTQLFFDRCHDMLPPCQSSYINNNMERRWLKEGRKQEEDFYN